MPFPSIELRHCTTFLRTPKSLTSPCRTEPCTHFIRILQFCMSLLIFPVGIFLFIIFPKYLISRFGVLINEPVFRKKVKL